MVLSVRDLTPYDGAAALHTVQDMQARQRTQEPPTVPDLLTATQVGQRLGVDASTIYRMAADGRLPAVKVGRQWRFHAGVVDALLGPASSDPDPSGRGRGVDPAQAQATIAVVADLLGVMMVVTDMAGTPVTEVMNPCPWLAVRRSDPRIVEACTREWRALADDLAFEPRFRPGVFGFACARSYIRRGSQLVGMVLAGGVADAAAETADDGLYHLDDAARARVLTTLPKVAAALSRAGAAASPDPATSTGQE